LPQEGEGRMQEGPAPSCVHKYCPLPWRHARLNAYARSCRGACPGRRCPCMLSVTCLETCACPCRRARLGCQCPYRSAAPPQHSWKATCCSGVEWSPVSIVPHCCRPSPCCYPAPALASTWDERKWNGVMCSADLNRNTELLGIWARMRYWAIGPGAGTRRWPSRFVGLDAWTDCYLVPFLLFWIHVLGIYTIFW